jgi:hypothetical protein
MRFGIAPRGMRDALAPVTGLDLPGGPIGGIEALFHAVVERLILPVRDMFD